MRKSVLIYNLAPYRSRSNIPKKISIFNTLFGKIYSNFFVTKKYVQPRRRLEGLASEAGKTLPVGGACGCCSDSWRLLSPLRQIGSDLLSSVFAQNCGQGECSGYCPVGFAQPGVRPGERGPGGADCGLEAGPDCHCGRYG